MAALLREAAKHGIAPNYVHQLRAAFRESDRKPPNPQLLIEPQSERERDVLRLLRAALNGPDIAHELIVSLNTVRTHTKNMYTKLGVNSRRASRPQAEQRNLV